MNSERDFNPYAYINLHDEDSDADEIDLQGIVHDADNLSSSDDDEIVNQYTAWPCIQESDDLTVTEALDGIVLVSDSPGIVKIGNDNFLIFSCVNIKFDFIISAGSMKIKRFPTVFDHRTSHYKGMQEYFNAASHVYEINLSEIGGYNFCCLVCTWNVVSPDKSKF